MGDIKYTNKELGIKYEHLEVPQVTSGFTLSNDLYEIEGNELKKYPKPLINATDINWGGVNIGQDNIYNTDQLLKIIGSKWVNDFGEIGVLGISVMLRSIRALQEEVNRLRNSIIDGIYSYTGKQTKISTELKRLTEDIGDGEEPLWAVDESTLSLINSVNLTVENTFEHFEDNELSLDGQSIILHGLNKWIDDPESEVSITKVTDPKIYIYLTTTGLDITFHLEELDNPENTLNIELDKLVNGNEIGLYNILFLLATSVKQTDIDEVYKGDNFVWIKVGHYLSESLSQQGYYNKTTNKLVDSSTINNANLTFGDTRYTLKYITFKDLTLSKFNIYSRYQNFKDEVESINPDNYVDRYKVAHITIRSIDTYDNLLEIKDQLPENELIYVETGNTLYIKNGYKIKKLGLGGNQNNNGENNQNDDNTMTNRELLTALKNMGIVYEHYKENDDTKDYDLQLAALDSVTFVHQATGKKFDISVDAYGQLKSIEQNQIQTLEDKFGNQIDDIMSKQCTRGFVANVNTINTSSSPHGDKDLKLNADRIKIGAIYAPLDSETTFGCSHAYVELENTSDKDFPLNNCYLHYCKWNGTSYETYHLALDGYIPKGSTYLIRGKKYITVDNDANVFIKVDTYDKEWWIEKTINENGQEKTVKELIDFTMIDQRESPSNSWSFALTYKNENLLYTDSLWANANSDNLPSGDTAIDKYTDQKVYKPGFIDAISINNTSDCGWAGGAFTQTKNCIYKNTFELDPAKQAFNGLHPKDSSRTRWKNAATDFQYVLLDKNIIEFPKTDEVKYIKDYTPKASYEHKNVCTDKTQFDLEKPNMPTVSFGIDAFTTRCFNWLSAGNFNEYVFIKNPDGTTWSDGNVWKAFESYKQRNLTKKETKEKIKNKIDGDNGTSGLQTFISNNEIPTNAKVVKNKKKRVFKWTIPEEKDEQGNIIRAEEEKSAEFNVTNENYQIKYFADNQFASETSAGWYVYEEEERITSTSYEDKEYIDYLDNKGNSTNYPLRKEYNYDICNIGFCGLNYKNPTLVEGKRVSNVFPASNIYYTSHKCVVDILSDNDINSSSFTSSKTYTYVVGRADKTGKAPDLEHCSKELHFTMYPKSYTPRVYHITDQQGFHWIEYQAWAAAAKELNKMINNENTSTNKIIPVLINTGDMTQSGARINEWLDYYNAGECLFNHLEQMNVVGNNDLCGTDVTILGTGDDPGKSNGYFYYICYCYDIPNYREINTTNNIYNIAPIVNNTIIPSLYYFEFKCNNNKTYRICMVNSEITLVNCKEWFGLKYGSTGYTANIYTGFSVKDSYKDSDSTHSPAYVANNLSFTPIYTILYYMLNCHKVNDTQNPDNIKYLVFCHEMPFTVITVANIAKDKYGLPRSVNGNNSEGSSMVGSKLNHIVWWENKIRGYEKGLHWFSRLLEYKGVKLCIGGHKHTYCVTYPLREYYQYTENGVLKNSKDHGPMPMDSTLQNDTANFIWKETFPFNNTNIIDNEDVDHTKLPLTYRTNVGYTNEKAILYPYTYPNETTYKKNAVIYFMLQATGYKLTSNKELPTAKQKFTNILPETNNVTEKPNANQQYPMFAIYELSSSGIKPKLGRFHNILNDSDHTFTQLSYGTGEIYVSYMKRDEASNDYGKWMEEPDLIAQSKNLYIYNNPITW